MTIIKTQAAKRLSTKNAAGEKESKQFPVPKGIYSHYCPDLAEVAEHLATDGALVLDEKKPKDEYDIPQYTNVVSAWIMNALVSAARTKARSGVSVTGETPETLALTTDDLPLTLEDLVKVGQKGNVRAQQQKAFLVVFGKWANDGGLKRPAQFINQLKSTSYAGVRDVIREQCGKAVAKFLDTLPEGDEEKYSVFLTWLEGELSPEEEAAEDWDMPI